jgi:hypothetical protein
MTIKIIPMAFLLSQFGLTDGTSAPVILVTKPPAGTALPFSFSPLLRPGLSFHRALAEGYDRLGQLLALLRKNLHAYDDQDNANSICIWPANSRKKARDWNLTLITVD